MRQISVELAGVEKERRTEELRRRLREVQAQFLPSRAIYIPLGRRRHHVYRIAVEASDSYFFSSFFLFPPNLRRGHLKESDEDHNLHARPDGRGWGAV